MHHDRTMFKEYTRLKHKLFIGGIKGGLHVVGIGTVPVMDRKGHVCMLQKVLHVPHLKTGLMSLTQLALAGYTITIDDKGCTVSNEKFSIHSTIDNGLCWWVPNPTSDTAAFFAEAFHSKVASLEDWHQPLAHISKDTLIKFGDNTFADLIISECEGDHGSTQHCSSYEVGKHHRLPFRSVPKKSDAASPWSWFTRISVNVTSHLSAAGAMYLPSLMTAHDIAECTFCLTNLHQWFFLRSRNIRDGQSDRVDAKLRSSVPTVERNIWARWLSMSSLWVSNIISQQRILHSQMVLQNESTALSSTWYVRCLTALVLH